MPRVEFFGVLRLRAGVAHVDVEAASVGEALAKAEEALMGLRSLLLTDGKVSSAYRVSLNGIEFLTDLTRPIQLDDSLLLIAADPGG